MFCRYLLIPVGSKSLLVLQCPCSVCFHDLFIGESGVLRSPTIIVWGAMYFLSFSRISFMNVGAFLFGAYMLRIENSC